MSLNFSGFQWKFILKNPNCFPGNETFSGIRDNELEYLELLASENNVIVITLMESHLNNRVEDNEIHTNSYASTRSPRMVREGGGVITYVRDHLKVSCELSESDAMNDLMCVYINELNI